MSNFFKSNAFKVIISCTLIVAFIGTLDLKFNFLNLSALIKKDKTNLVAEVDNVKITEKDLQNAIENVKNEMINSENGDQNSINFSPEEEKLFQENILNSLINEKLLMKFADKIGLKINDEIAIEHIKKTPNFISESGLFDEKKLQEFLENIGMSERKYIDEIKKNIIIYGVFSALNKNYSNIIFRDNILFDNLRRVKVIDLIEMNFENFLKLNHDKIQIPQEKIQKFYDENQSSYTIPEYRKMDFAILKLSDVRSKTSIDNEILNAKIDQELKDTHDNDIRSFDNIICESESDSRSIIEYLKTIKYSMYKDTNISNIFKEKDLKCFLIEANDKRKNDISEKFRSNIFEKLNQENESYFSKDLIETNLGKHILVLKNIRKLEKKDLEEDISASLISEKANEEYRSLIENIRKEIESETSLENLLNKYNLKFQNKNYFNKMGDYLDDLDQYASIGEMKSGNYENYLNLDENLLKNIFSSTKDQLNLFKINENEYIVYKISDIKPENVKTFDESKDAIRDILVDQSAFSEFVKISSDISQSLKLNQEKINDILESNEWINIKKNIDFSNPILVKMNLNKQAGNFSPILINQITNNHSSFDEKNEKKIIGPINIDQNIFIGIEKSIKYKDISDVEKDKIFKALDYTTYINESNEIFNSILESLKKEYKIKNFLNNKVEAKDEK